MKKFILKLENLGLNTNRRFLSDIIDDYRKIPVESIKNYRISRKSLSSENKPKFLSIANGREFYYIIDDIKIENISLNNSVNKTQQSTKIEEKQTKETFDISKSKQIFDQSQNTRLDNLRDKENIFKTKIDVDIDITNQLKKIKLYFPGRDTLFIQIPEDPNEIGAKFILKGIKYKDNKDFIKI